MSPEKSLSEILAHCMRVGAPLPVPIALAILRQVCDALAYAHDMCDPNGQPLGLVHRDVSPATIYITQTGVATLVASATPHSRAAYAAPEYVMAGMFDARSDLFAVGVVAHEMLANRPLFAGGDDRETLARVCSQDAPPPSTLNPYVPPDLDGIVLTALARDPAYRWQHAAMLRDWILSITQRFGLEVTPAQHAAWLEQYAATSAPPPPYTPAPYELPAPAPAPALAAYEPAPAPPPPREPPAPAPARHEPPPASHADPVPPPRVEQPPVPPAPQPPGDPDMWAEDPDLATRIEEFDQSLLDAINASGPAPASAPAPTATPAPAPTATPAPPIAPAPTATPIPRVTPTPTPRPMPRATPAPAPRPTPMPQTTPAPTPRPTPRPTGAPAPAAARSSGPALAQPARVPTPRPMPAPTPVPAIAAEPPPAPAPPEPAPAAEPPSAPTPPPSFDPELGPEPTQIGAMPLISFGDAPLVALVGENDRRTPRPRAVSLPPPVATFLPEAEPPPNRKKQLVIAAAILVGVVAVVVIVLVAS